MSSSNHAYGWAKGSLSWEKNPGNQNKEGGRGAKIPERSFLLVYGELKGHVRKREDTIVRICDPTNEDKESSSSHRLRSNGCTECLRDLYYNYFGDFFPPFRGLCEPLWPHAG